MVAVRPSLCGTAAQQPIVILTVSYQIKLHSWRA